MPPKDPQWPSTKAEFDRLAGRAKTKFLPLVRNLQVYELVGMSEAVEIALDEFKPLAAAEDIRRGDRPPGTSVGRAGT